LFVETAQKALEHPSRNKYKIQNSNEDWEGGVEEERAGKVDGAKDEGIVSVCGGRVRSQGQMTV